LQVTELFREPDEVADSIIVAIGKGLDMKLLNDGVLVPELVTVDGSAGALG
jgi:hypothetical protein